MPILWRFLLKTFLKIMIATVVAFVAILLTMRLDEIAHFAGLGAPIPQLLMFTLYQVPYILPIALPLACLIAASLLIQRLSQSHELTALRSSGLSLGNILKPILLAAFFLSIVNFWITSELATHSHLESNRLKSELRAINPLLLLSNKHLMKLKGFYFEAARSSRTGESVEEAILALPNHHRGRIYLMIAKKLNVNPLLFSGEKVSFLVTIPNEQEEDFDHLIIENMEKSITQTEHFSDFIQHKAWSINNDYLQLPLLLTRMEEQREELLEKKREGVPYRQLKQQEHEYEKSQSEIIKRLSIALAVFSFTVMGAVFAINISRKKPFLPHCIVMGLTLFYLVSFFVARGLEHQFWLSTALYLVPHAIIVCASLFFLRRMNRGIEIW